MEAAGMGMIITGIPLILIVYRAYVNGAYSNDFNTTTTTTIAAGLDLLVVVVE